MRMTVSYKQSQVHLTRLEPATNETREASSRKALDGYLMRLEPATEDTTKAEHTGARNKSASAGSSPWNGVTGAAHLIDQGGHSEFLSSLHNHEKKETDMNDSRNSVTRPMVSIPRQPTAEDTQALMEFLAQEHPQLHEALQLVEQIYRTLGLDLNVEDRGSDESNGA